MNNPFLFACGVPRSGTTLLQRMLDHHPELAVANDTHFIPRALELTDKKLIERAEAGLPIPLTSDLVDNVRNYHRFYRLGIEDDEFEKIRQRSETYDQLVSGLYDLLAKKSNKRLAGEKTPDYVRRQPLLHGLFPNAKIIHLVRDGRNVALSLLKWASPTKGPGRIELWNEDPIAVCALWWRWLVMASRPNQFTSEKVLEISYEDLVRDAESTMIRVCDFLELEFSNRMLDYHQGKSKRGEHLSAKSAWLSPQSGLRNWNTDMEPRDVELFELLASDALHEFGYELRNGSPSRQTIETANRYREWWEQNFLPRQEKSQSVRADEEFNDSKMSDRATKVFPK